MDEALLKCVAALCGAPSAPSPANGEGLHACLRRLCSESGAKGADLLGNSPVVKAQVDSWLDIAAACKAGAFSEHLPSLDEYLTLRSYLAGPRLTLADAVVYYAAVQSELDIKHTNVVRWALQCQFLLRSACGSKACGCPPVRTAAPLPSEPVTLPVPKAPQAGKQPAPAGKKGKDKAGDNASSKGAPPEAAAAAAQGGKKQGKGGSNAPKEGKKGSTKDAAAAAAPAAAATAEDDAPDPTKLDIRVGVITKAWPHPEADKLYCEEIDLGEGKPRQIASGLRHFYDLPAMQGRRVLVLANLKSRTMVGFKSEGMVLCASNADHTAVKFVAPPDGAPPGARVTFPGRTGEPAAASQVQKKKILEQVLPGLRTDGAGVPGYEGCPFTVEGFGACSSELPDASVA